MKMDSLKTTNNLLLILAVPVVFYVLKLLSFIFIPLVLAIFIALLFMPLIRWFARKKVHKAVALSSVILILAVVIFSSVKLVQLSGMELTSGKADLYEQLDEKIGESLTTLGDLAGIDTRARESTLASVLFDPKVSNLLYDNFGATLVLVRKTVSVILMTIFFLVLLLAGSLNFKDILQDTVFKQSTRSVKTFRTIEKSIAKFIMVKFIVSLGTGIGFSLICVIFDISFPLFWGLFAFTVNFIQMVGTVISTIFASLFALIELQSPGTIAGAILLFTAVQVLFGGVLEPIMMGKSFSINIVTILVMLMFWGFLWGVPGLILAIPITVLIKTILEQFESSRVLARIMD